MTTTPSAKLRRKILKDRGIQLAKHTRKPITYDDLPSIIVKSHLMKLIELKHSDKLENLIFEGTIYAAAKKLNVSPSTISKWRKLVSEARETEFWKQFPSTVS
ncbi:hypothetical protein LCGC14_1868810 [marine sediment metagenome]|uniref:Uncharacterized protein n=1 Tax=marine sediment metagenome TaxID=412755 RepID=A0A0F9J4B1_9ZZZZ